MTTTRERKLRRAARLREWADKRRDKADAIERADASLRRDLGFVAAQPGIGRLPITRRINARQEREWEHRKTAGSMASRAAGIEAEAERAIYSDDEDAADQLRARIAELEAEQARVKAFNAEVRKAKGDRAKVAAAIDAHLTDRERAEFLSVVRFTPYNKPEERGFPSYHLSNLSANIRRNKERLAQIEREAAPGFEEKPRILSLRYPGTCRDCGRSLERGTDARYYRKAREVACWPAC